MPNLDPNIVFPVGCATLTLLWIFLVYQAYKSCNVDGTARERQDMRLKKRRLARARAKDDIEVIW